MGSQMTLPFQTIPSLNGIRAVSVLIVMAAHAGYGEIIPGGFGVTVFFFLSGYLITSLLFNEYDHTGSIGIRNFYIRRFLRLFPPLFLTLAIAYLLVFINVLPGGITLYGVLSQIFYFANYYAIFVDFGGKIPEGTVILWSLAVEEHFYIFYPVVLLALTGFGLRRREIGYVFAFVCVAVLLWRIYLSLQPGFHPARTYFGTDTRIDSILYGALLALWSNPMDRLAERGRMSGAQWLLVAGALCILVFTFVYRDETFRQTFRYSLQGLALYPLFYCAVRFHENFVFRPLNWTWVSRIGVWSYSIYLMHFIVIQLMIAQWSAVADKPFILFLASFVVCVFYAVLIDRWVDPYFRRRHRAPASEGQSQHASPVPVRTRS